MFGSFRPSRKTPQSQMETAWPRPAAASAQEPTETQLRHTESPDTTAALSILLSQRLFCKKSPRRCHPVRSTNLFHKRTDELEAQKREKSIIKLNYYGTRAPRTLRRQPMELSVVLNPVTRSLTGRKVVSFNYLIEAHLWFYLLQVLVSLMEQLSFPLFCPWGTE